MSLWSSPSWALLPFNSFALAPTRIAWSCFNTRYTCCDYIFMTYLSSIAACRWISIGMGDVEQVAEAVDWIAKHLSRRFSLDMQIYADRICWPRASVPTTLLAQPGALLLNRPSACKTSIYAKSGWLSMIVPLDGSVVRWSINLLITFRSKNTHWKNRRWFHRCLIFSKHSNTCENVQDPLSELVNNRHTSSSHPVPRVHLRNWISLAHSSTHDIVFAHSV